MVANLFPLGPFHPEGYPIILKHLSTRCPGYPQWEQVASGFPFFLAKRVAYVEPDLEFGLWYYSATIACESMKIHTAFVRDL
jgi:hypothetical protein